MLSAEQRSIHASVATKAAAEVCKGMGWSPVVQEQWDAAYDHALDRMLTTTVSAEQRFGQGPAVALQPPPGPPSPQMAGQDVLLTNQHGAATTTAGNPVCPDCRGPLRDNRAAKTAGKVKAAAPNFSCEDRGCNWHSGFCN